MEIQPATTQQIAAFKAAAAQRYRDLGIKPDNADWVFNRMMEKLGADLGVLPKSAGFARPADPEVMQKAERLRTMGRGVAEFAGSVATPLNAKDSERAGGAVRAGSALGRVFKKDSSDRVTKVASAIAKALGRQAKHAQATAQGARTNATPVATAPVEMKQSPAAPSPQRSPAAAQARKPLGFPGWLTGGVQPGTNTVASLRRQELGAAQ